MTWRLSLDLYRAPLLAWIVPFLMVLSMTEKVSGRSFLAPSASLFLIASLTFLTWERIVDLFCLLTAARRRLRRSCLIADL